MKHNDYFRLVEDLASRDPQWGNDCPYEFIFKDGGNYYLKKHTMATHIELSIFVGSNRNAHYLNHSYSVAIRFHRKRDINGDYLGSMDSPINLENFDGSLGVKFVIEFPNRTESEDNYLKLRAGKYYEDVCLLYTRLNEKIK